MKCIKNFLLLALAALFMVLSNGHYLFGFASWVFPMLFMFATKKFSTGKTLLITTLLSGLSFFISFLFFTTNRVTSIIFYIPLFMGMMYGAAYYVQKLGFQKSNSFVTTLLFPSIFCVIEYLILFFSPNGTFGLLGYSQIDFPVIAQSAALFGTIGITFLITWTSTIVYWYFAVRHKELRNTGIVVYIAIVLAILSFGTVRLLSDNPSDTVMISGIHVYDVKSTETREIFDLVETDEEAYIEKSGKFAELLIQQTEYEAKLGSKIIVHAECMPNIHHTKVDEYLTEIGEIAKEYNVYIITSPFINYAGIQKDENVVYIIDPDGKIALTHYKYGGNLFEGTVCGDKNIRYVDTEYGRISAVICWDKDFPTVIDQVGEKDIDILFIPSADWKAITPTHTIQGNFRGIENGVNIVTQSVNGMSMISNYKGQVTAAMNHFETDKWIMRGQVSTSGTNTIYNIAGKYFYILVILILIISSAVTFFVKDKQERLV